MSAKYDIGRGHHLFRNPVTLAEALHNVAHATQVNFDDIYRRITMIEHRLGMSTDKPRKRTRAKVRKPAKKKA